MEGMALSLAESATGPLMNKLGSMLVQEAELLAGIYDEALFIADELKSMLSFLRALSSRNNHQDEQVRTWIEQVNDIAYDAEDAIDTFTFYYCQWQRGLHAPFWCLLAPLTNLRPRHAIAANLQRIRIRARDVSDRRSRYYVSSVADNHPSAAAAAPDSSASLLSVIGEKLWARYNPSSVYFSANLKDPSFPLYARKMQPVGFDRHIDSVIKKLLAEEQPELVVVPLCGFPGQGKTTLARFVFQSPAVNSQFDVRAWNRVAQSYDTQTILQTMIGELSIGVREIHQALGRPFDGKDLQQDPGTLGEAGMVKVINHFLLKKRYLLVLDDILDIKMWEDIKLALPDSKNGSRVIVTTPKKQVARACSSNNHDHIRIPPLSPDESWELFRRRAFGGHGNGCPPDLVDVSRRIVRKCGGRPLAIEAIAGLVAVKTDKTIEELTKTHDQLLFDLESNPTLEGLEQVLTVAYNDLPYHLKPCFLYLSVFPKYYKISRKRLVRRWEAEGLVCERHGMSAEQVGLNFFDELISRGLIMPSKIGHDDTVKSCTVHNITMDVIVSISMEQNFVSVLGDHSLSTPAQGKIRRLSLDETSTHDLATVNLSCVRSFTTFGRRVHLSDYRKVKLLRVLDLDGCKSLASSHLKNISKLFLLKFLSLRNSSINKLPDVIGNLLNLQVLDVRGTAIDALPATLIHLKKLKRLLGGNTQREEDSSGAKCMKMPRGLGGMKSLVTLVVVDGSDGSNSHLLREIGELTKLEKLDVNFGGGVRRTKESWKQFGSSLEKLNSLRSLKVFGASGQPCMLPLDLDKPPYLLQKMHLEGSRIEQLPPWLASLGQISKIVLRETLLKPEVMKHLKTLPALLKLVLGINSFDCCGEDGVGQPLAFEGDGFTKLRFLHVESMGMRFHQAALPNLESLTILKKYSGRESISGLVNLQKLWLIRVDPDNEATIRVMLKSEMDERPNYFQWTDRRADD